VIGVNEEHFFPVSRNFRRWLQMVLDVDGVYTENMFVIFRPPRQGKSNTINTAMFRMLSNNYMRLKLADLFRLEKCVKMSIIF
jgi:hypothetical protein